MQLETQYLSEFPLSLERVQSSQLCLSVIRNKLTSFQREIADDSRSCEVFVKLAVVNSVRFHKNGCLIGNGGHTFSSTSSFSFVTVLLVPPLLSSMIGGVVRAAQGFLQEVQRRLYLFKKESLFMKR